jgi:hypothetical protein
VSKEFFGAQRILGGAQHNREWLAGTVDFHGTALEPRAKPSNVRRVETAFSSISSALKELRHEWGEFTIV